MKALLLLAVSLLCAYAIEVRKADVKADPLEYSYSYSSSLARNRKNHASSGESKQIKIIGGGVPPCKVELYQFSNYKGKKQTYTKSGNIKSNDGKSSIKIPTGCCVTIFEKQKFGGKRKKYCKNTKFVGTWWNKRMSSIRVQRVSGGSARPACSVQFFQLSHYRGIRVTYTKSGNSKHKHPSSSIKVPAGCCVAVYEKGNFGGRSRKFCRNTKLVHRRWNKRISSFRLFPRPLFLVPLPLIWFDEGKSE